MSAEYRRFVRRLRRFSRLVCCGVKLSGKKGNDMFFNGMLRDAPRSDGKTGLA